MENMIQLNETEIKSQLGELVKKSVEETLSTLLDAEVDQITQAHRYFSAPVQIEQWRGRKFEVQLATFLSSN